MMKLKFLNALLAMLLLTGVNAFAGEQKIMLFSDMDDTVKVSYISSKVGMANYSTFSDSLFYGMDQVYRAVNDYASGEIGFHYVSNGWAPTVKGTHSQLLHQFNFPNPDNYHSRVLKTIIKFQPHKTRVISEIIQSEKPDTVILIGDNGERDHRYYNEIETALAGVIKFKTYIHLVEEPAGMPNFGLYPGQQGFADAADLALKLFSDGLLDRNSTWRIVADIVRKINSEPRNAVYGPLVYPFYKVRPAYDNANHYMCRAFYTL